MFIVKIQGQPLPNTSTLSIEQIMLGEKFVGYLPDNIAWSDDSRSIYFSWNPDGDTLRGNWKISVGKDGKTGPPARLTNEERKALPARGNYDRTRTKKTYSKNGDLFLMERAAGAEQWTIRQITNTMDSESDPDFSGDGSRIIFRKENNLFSWHITDGTTVQLTDFRKGNERKEKKKSPQDQWLEDDQLALFDVLAERKAKREAQKRDRESLDPKRPKPFYFGEKRLSNLSISPNGRYVTFRLTSSADEKSTDVPDFVTESGYVEQLRARAKVGSPLDETEFGIFDRERDTVYIVDTKQIEGIYDKPDFLREYHQDTLPFEDKYKKPRPVVLHGPVFSEDGKALVVAKSLDNKDRWLLLLDLQTGNLRLLDRQRDEAWIGGPGISSWNFAMGSVGWLPDNLRVWFHSEATGYSHLYTVHVETGERQALTAGNFEILDARLSNDKKHFYITSNKETPFEHHFYKMPVPSGTARPVLNNFTKITSLPGGHQVEMSPDEQWLAVRYAYSNKPWELYLMPNRPGAAMVQLTSSTTEDFSKYPWREPEIVWFKASDGAEVPARLYRPSAGKRNGAAVVFVHGAGYLQNVHRWWSSYYREFMFHNLLADNGYTVLDIDYRGSQGYGRDWRTGIYRFMGGKDLSDHVDGARYLVEEHRIHPRRIGIYGGSYGGFITLMAMFTSPGTFKSGAALRSVTDWAHYNHGYTANILNTPTEDSIPYRRSSPIYHAAGLQDHLLILHGMVDVNVQFQDVVRLAQRLIELKKDNWEFAVYPVEDHGFVEPDSWTDEYRRIFKLFQDTLRE